jgi:hypothetical protein
MLCSQFGMQACFCIVQFALQAFELVKDWSAAARCCWSASGFDAAARTRSDHATGTRITCGSCNFSSAGWTNATTSHFGSAAWVSNGGITAGAVGSNAVSTQQSVQKFAAEALSTKASAQNHRTN